MDCMWWSNGFSGVGRMECRPKENRHDASSLQVEIRASAGDIYIYNIVADSRLEPRFGKVGENPTSRVRIRESIV